MEKSIKKVCVLMSLQIYRPDSNNLKSNSDNQVTKEAALSIQVDSSGRRLFNPVKSGIRNKASSSNAASVYSGFISRVPSGHNSKAPPAQKQETLTKLATLTIEMFNLKNQVELDYSKEINLAYNRSN